MRDHFEARVVQALQDITETLQEVQEGLPWPTSEHVSYKIAIIRESLSSIELPITEKEQQ